uniref:Methyltransferase n=1 Tax=Fusarium oxysporum (strain Fo5176) TaxID=660025 RepID=A0A0D2YG92_FUSOF
MISYSDHQCALNSFHSSKFRNQDVVACSQEACGFRFGWFNATTCRPRGKRSSTTRALVTITRGELWNAVKLLSLTWAVSKEENTAEDGDSAVLENASSTASLTSSILQYRTINGRAYQSERGNPEYCHHVLTLLLGDKLHLAPVPDDIQVRWTGTNVMRVLQAHTNLREFADKFPNASVIGTDLAPIQPGWIPPNLELRLHSTVDFPTHSFDYIHMRWLVGSIADWKSLFKESYKCLKPGATSKAMSHHHASKATTVKFCQAREGMREAGFVNIEERDFKNPVGGWPKDPKQRSAGQYMQAAFEQDAQGTVLHMATALGWTEEEVTVFISHFRHEIRSPKIHSYFRQKVVWGRKPL